MAPKKSAPIAVRGTDEIFAASYEADGEVNGK